MTGADGLRGSSAQPEGVLARALEWIVIRRSGEYRQ